VAPAKPPLPLYATALAPTNPAVGAGTSITAGAGTKITVDAVTNTIAITMDLVETTVGAMRLGLPAGEIILILVAKTYSVILDA